MKRIFAPGLVLLLSVVCLFAGPRDAQWKKVEEAIKQGLPKTAITNLEPIIQGALRDRAYAEAVKAVGEKIALEGNIQGNKPEERIIRLRAELSRAPQPMVPVLHALLADWYWQYFQQNRWRFMRRTATAEAPGRDFTTWDLPRLFSEIDQQFQKALAAEALLKKVPVADWDALLVKGTMPDSYRPTLYDFVAHEALDFYTSGEQAAARPEDAFELAADSPVLDAAGQFLRWQPATTDTNATELKAIVLFQHLMRFHEADPEPRLALAAADLDRLTWGGNTATGEDKAARYKNALQGFIGRYAEFEISALAMEHEARLLQQEGDLVAAHRLAQRGATTFPNSPGGKLCHNLVVELESKSLQVRTERVWNCFDGAKGSEREGDKKEHCAALTVDYRNLEAVYFRAIPFDWEVFLQRSQQWPENLDQKEQRAILAKKPALEWSEKLSATTNYQAKSVQFTAPTRLKPGFYFIAASGNAAFSEKNNVIALTSVWVSDLALVTRTREGRIEGFVLDAGSGEPLTGAEISVWRLENTGNRIAEPTLTTDTNGYFAVKSGVSRSYVFRVRYQGRELASAGGLWVYDQPSTARPQAQTVFFTDRAIYRPGQTVQYKGICLWVDQAANNYEILKREPVTVVFRDPNGKEIARQEQRANDFGSFSGSFTAPRDRLMGQMSLAAEGRALGQTWVRVEEYKRPKFEVTLEAPRRAARLDENVSLRGHAMSYTGAAVDGAEVKYRVVREVRMPWWWGWWGGGLPNRGSQDIAHGTLRTGTDGAFTIEFRAAPDRTVPEKDEPTFEFHITADVTDNAGETRSNERDIRVGYTALEAKLSADDWQTAEHPVEMAITTRSLDDEPQAAEGILRIYELQPPAEVHRAPLGWSPYQAYSPTVPVGSGGGQSPDLSNPNNWPLGKVVEERGFTTDTNGTAKLSFKLAVGEFRAVVETKDRFGKKVTGRLALQVLAPQATRLAMKIPHLLAAPEWQAQAGQDFMALWGTGYGSGRALIEIERQHQILQRYWTRPDQTQQQINVAVTEAMRGGFTLHVTQVRNNRAYLDSRTVQVPWKNKQLDVRWEHFVSKLLPGQKETWTAVITPPRDGKSEGEHRSPERSAAEMVATLYDESLDAFVPHHWMAQFNVFRQEYSNWQLVFANTVQPLRPVIDSWEPPFEAVSIRYRSFPEDLTMNLWGYRWFLRSGLAKGGTAPAFALPREAEKDFDSPLAATAANSEATFAGAMDRLALAQEPATRRAVSPAPPKPDLSQVTARKNLNETAFFFPQLTSDTNGVVRITFTMPEALTRWHFLGFAHDSLMRSGLLDAHAVTAKDLMVQPNPPRFLREGDTIEFTVKVSNQSDQPQTGTVRLTFGNALEEPAPGAETSGKPSKTDRWLGNTRLDQAFAIPAKESRSFAWRIRVPDGCGFLSYKAVAASATVSDGEEGAIPVLSRRILVTESLPLPIRGAGTKKFEFQRLLDSGHSRTLQNESLTLQMVSHPAWYAVLALPYLMEYPYECSEQTFNRFYANALARRIANSNPKIHKVFEQWRNTPALDSPLEKNQDLKSVALEETPWLRQAESESQARRNIGVLFDDNRLNYELEHTLQKLGEMQLPDGAWPWFPGGESDNYITLYITCGFGRLRHLGVDVNMAPALHALARLDAWMKENYDLIQQRPNPEAYVPSALDALYLYTRSFFLKDQPVAPADQEALQFFLVQSRKCWLQTNCRQTQGQLALALSRFSAAGGGSDATPAHIMASLKERSVTSEELGMFWRDTELSWWWYRAPIETQALMIEAFDEVAHDPQAVEECKVWLLKQKQTQDWKTTKATADAVYALLLRGDELLSSDALVQVKLDGIDVTPGSARARKLGAKLQESAQPEPGTGFYEVRFTPDEIKPSMGRITVKKVDPGVAWGSVHWQYLEDMSKVTPYAGTPLKLKKTLYTKVATSHGETLEPVRGPVRVGDELVVRIELRTDRDMEYVHLKDERGSGTEPVNVLSGYRYQDGLAYYESTRDTASHFFIPYLPKGTYVFEYSSRIQLRGEYQTGVASIQCMYAPEFNSHSESVELRVTAATGK